MMCYGNRDKGIISSDRTEEDTKCTISTEVLQGCPEVCGNVSQQGGRRERGRGKTVHSVPQEQSRPFLRPGIG